MKARGHYLSTLISSYGNKQYCGTSFHAASVCGYCRVVPLEVVHVEGIRSDD